MKKQLHQIYGGQVYGFCDNTDCSNPETRQELWQVKLIKDFNNEDCYWCAKCLKRDKKMLKEQ